MTDDNLTTQPTLMLIDDESMVLEVSSLMIESLGYQVDAFLSPVEALSSYTEKSNTYDLVIIDMMMPNMSGKELFTKLKEINPNVKAIISSGFQMNESDTDLLALGIKGFINKPFTIEILKNSLNNLLQN